VYLWFRSHFYNLSCTVFFFSQTLSYN
jgi:hypothetical protein